MSGSAVNEHRQAPDSSLLRAARGSVLNLVGSAVGAMAAFALAVTITQLSSAPDAGVFFSATSLFLIAINLGRLGTQTGLVYFVSGARGRGERGAARAYLRIASQPVALVAVLMSGTMIVFAEPLAELLSAERAETFATSVRLMALLIPSAAILHAFSAASQGLGTMKIFSVLELVLLPITQLAFVACAVWVGADTFSAAVWAAAYLPVAIFGWLWWRRMVARMDGPQSDAVPPSRTAFWKFTAPRAVASVAQITMQRLDIILVGALASLSAAAVYAALTRFLVLGQLAGRAISQSVQPLLRRALARGDHDDGAQLYRACTAWLVLGTWPLYLLLIAFAPSVLTVFGEGYDEGSSALVLLCVAMLFATGCGMVDIVLNMAGKTLWNLVNVLIALTFFVGMNLILIPRMGLMGAAVSWATAIVLMNLLPLLQVLHTPGMHPFGRATLMAMGMSSLCFGLLPWLATVLLPRTPQASAAGVAAGLVLYVCLLISARRGLRLALLSAALRPSARRKRDPAS